MVFFLNFKFKEILPSFHDGNTKGPSLLPTSFFHLYSSLNFSVFVWKLRTAITESPTPHKSSHVKQSHPYFSKVQRSQMLEAYSVI